MAWEPTEEFADGLFPPDMLAEKERDQTVYFVVTYKMHGTDKHVAGAEETLKRTLDLAFGEDRTTVTRVKPDGSTIVLRD